MALVSLSRNVSGNALPHDAYDVRGWEVRTEPDDEAVGSVDDMLLDPDGTPRYLDVELEASGRHLLLPLGRAHADSGAACVWVEGLRAEQLERIPAYEHEAESVTPEYEARLREDYRRVTRGEEPEAPVDDGRLARLDDMEDFQVAEADTDPRGWLVISGDETEIGEVVELIVDRREMTARYLDVAVDEKVLELEPVDRHILIPVARVRLHAGDEEVSVDGLFARDVARYPAYTGLPLDPGREREIEDIYAGGEEDGRRRWSGPEARHFFGWQGRPSPSAGDAADVGARSPGRAGKTATVRAGDQEVRIRVTGDDIIIEKHGRRE